MGVAVIYVPVVAGAPLFSGAGGTRHVDHHNYLTHTMFLLHDNVGVPSSLCVVFCVQVYSMNLELVGRVAPMELTVSPRLLAPLSGFLHSSKVRLDVSVFRFGLVFRLLLCLPLCIVIDVLSCPCTNPSLARSPKPHTLTPGLTRLFRQLCIRLRSKV